MFDIAEYSLSHLKRSSVSLVLLTNMSLVLPPAWSALIQNSFFSKPYSTTYLFLNPHFCIRTKIFHGIFIHLENEMTWTEFLQE